MKNTIATTFTGSLGLITILVLTSWFFAACVDYDKNLDPMAEALSEYICQGKCDRSYFKPFSGEMVHLEIEPTGQMAQVFYNVEPQGLVSSPIVLNDPVLVNGAAVGNNLDITAKKQRDKSALFSDIIALPLVNDRFLSPRIPTVKTSLGTDAKFALEVLSGIPYSLVLNPHGARNRAPFYLSAGFMNDESYFEFDMSDKQVKVKGRVIAKDRLIATDGSENLKAMVMQGNRLVSSVSPIALDGGFSLEISNPLFEMNMPINLVIEPADSEVGLPKVKIKLKPEELLADLDLKDIDIGSIEKPISITLEVLGDDSLVTKASVFLKAKIGVGESLIQKPLDASGITTLDKLYQGVYDIAVIPPADSPFAMQLLKAVKVADKEKVVVTLGHKQALTAQVFAPTGIPVSKAQIEFFRIGEMDNFATDDIYDDMLFKLIATTDDQGRVGTAPGFGSKDNSLLLNEGRYLAHIIPPDGSQLTHKWLTIDFPKEQSLVVNLSQPQVLSGQVVASDGHTPVKRAFITVYLAQNLHNRPKVMGNAITDDMGFFKAFVSQP